MNLKQLLYFVEVAEAGGFSKASFSLSLAQSALSRHIALLEKELEAKLLIRTGRGVKLTEQGEYLLVQAREILHKKQDIERTLANWGDHPAGLVRLGLPPSLVLASAVQMIERVNERYPDVSLDISENISSEIGELIGSGRLDIGVVLGQRPPGNLHAEMIAMEELCIVTAKNVVLSDPPIKISSVLDHQLILPGESGSIRSSINRFAEKEGVTLTPTFTLNAMHAIKDLVAAGVGISILPRSSVLKELERGELKVYSISTKDFLIPVYLVYLNKNHMGRAADAVAGIVKQVLGKNLSKKINEN